MNLEEVPVGVMPERLWKEKRHHDLFMAIHRYMEAEVAIPTDWIDEIRKLTKELKIDES